MRGLVRGADLERFAPPGVTQLGSPAELSLPPPARYRQSPATFPFGVIEDVEGFGAELDGHTLLDRKMLEQGHIEVGATRVAQDISAGIAEGQPVGDGKGTGL